MTKNKQQSGLGKLSSSVGQGASIADMAYGRRKDVPNQHDNDAEFYSGIAKSFSAPGDRPRGFFANFGAGFAEGAAHSARSKGIKEKKAESDKHQQVMDYFQDVNKSAMEQNQWYADREKSIETIKPFAMGGLEVSYSGMDYATGNERMRNIMEQAKIADPSIKGDYVGYVPNSPIVNMRDEDGNIIAMSLSTLVGEDSVKRVQGSYVDQQVLSNKHRELDMKENELKAKYPSYGKEQMEGGGSEDYGSIPLDNIKKGGGGRSVMNTINSEMNLAKDIPVILSQLDEAEQIIKNNPGLGAGWNNFLSKGSFSKSLMDDTTRVAYEELEKIASRVEEAFIKAKGTSITDSERETIKKGLFQTTNTGEANKFNIKSIRKELAIAQERGDFAADELVNGRIATPKSFQKYQEAKKNKGNASEGGKDAWDSIIWRPSQ